MPKLYQTPPPHPGKKPLVTDEIKLHKWKQKADRFGTYFLVLFRPETNLYEGGQINTYKYNWNAFQEFKQSLKSGNFFNTMRYQTMQGYMYGWKTNRRIRAILSHYRGRNRTLWTNQEQQEAQAKYGKMRKTEDIL